MAKILLAEDDLPMRQFLNGSLVRVGHEVTACVDGLEALGELQENPEKYDLLLTDIVMPGMDGLELADCATRLNPFIKTLFITGFSGMAVDKASEKRPRTLLVSKPFHLNSLLAQIEELLNATD